MGWEIEFTDEWGEWYWSLTEEQQDAVVARLEMLEDQGPTLGRPTAAEIDGSKVPHLKELRCSKDGALRILFVFGTARQSRKPSGSTRCSWRSSGKKARSPDRGSG